MRVLLLFRGAPGCGKSTFIKEHNLEQYALSADDIRTKIQSPILMPDGSMGVSQKNEKTVWKTLFSLLEKRMDKGEFTVIDATNSKTSEMNRYKEFASKYKYRMYIVDMTDIPINIVKERNANRLPEYKRVPDEVIDKMYSRFATQKIPSGVKAIKPEELDTIMYKPIDLNKYKKIHHIGDIHGCFTALQEYLKDGIKDDELYIFCGDYLDRGLENVETLKFMLSIYKLPNVILLEGNHELLPLRNYASNIDDYPRYFRQYTLPELNEAERNKEFKKSDIRELCRKLGQLCYYTYGNKKVFVCHGGVSGLKENPIFISTEQLIRGVGEYEDYLKCTESFEKSTDENTYQISGHRNVTEVPIKATDRCFNLEGQVEHGGHLRIVTLDENGFKTHEIKNNVFKEKEEKVVEVKLPKEDLTNEDIIKQLRNSPYIKEKKMGDISSFNFTRDAFFKKMWNDQTTKARGLFIDTKDDTIIARGYEKFFNINEKEETKILNLQHTLKFPVTAYVKENGFLGLISYNKENGNLMFATKSIVDSAAQDDDLVKVFRNLYMELVTDDQHLNLIDYLAKNNKTIICECVHQEKDPHIIEYNSNRIYLLDIIDNDFNGEKAEYEYLRTVNKQFGLTCKEKASTFDNWEDFYGWYLEVTDEDYLYNERHIEGFVIEDSAGFMVKLKLAYYNFWKMMRGITHQVLKRGYLEKTSSLYNAEANYYYGWLRDRRDEYIRKDERGKVVFDDVDIIKMRKRFLSDMDRKG